MGRDKHQIKQFFMENEKMTEEHKDKIVEMLMEDYYISLPLAKLIVKVFLSSAEQIIREDIEIRKSK